MNLNQTIMDVDMVGWVLVALGALLLAAGLWYKPTRMVMSILLFLGGIAFTTTLYGAILGLPMMLVASVLLYSEYVQLNRPAHAAAGPMQDHTEPSAPMRHTPQRPSEADDDVGPADD